MIKKVKVNDVNIDKTYQRTLNNKVVNKIVNEFDKSLLGVITLSKRQNGKYYCLDGQHRLEALKNLGYKNVESKILFEVKNEAQTFIDLNTKTRKPNSLDLYRAKISAGDPLALLTEKTLKEIGYKMSIGTNSQPYTLKCPKLIQKMIHESGADHFKLVISTINTLYEQEPRSHSEGILEGYSYVYRFTNVDKKALIEKMSRISLRKVIVKAQELRLSLNLKRTASYGQAIMHLFNVGRKNKLYIDLVKVQNTKK